MARAKPLSKVLNSWEVIFLGIFAFLTRFFNLRFPSKVIFDEAHFGLYAAKYLSHQYYFDIHPPLGKMLLALFAFFGDVQAGFNFGVNSDYGDINFLALRFLPAFLGSLLILLIYFLVKEMGFSKRSAFLASFFVLFDNALIVQSRFILLDIILVFFIFLSFYLFLLTKKFPPLSFRWYLFHFLTGLSMGAAISIKWTGFGIFGLISILALKDISLSESLKKENLIKIFSILFLPIVIYFLIFALHFYFLPSYCESNCGYVLEETSFLDFDNDKQPQGNFFEKFVEVHKLMFFNNFIGPASFYYQSDWYSWLFMIRPVKYFEEPQNNKISYIFFLGNPFVWWLGTMGIIVILYLLVKNVFFSFKLKIPVLFRSEHLASLLLGYFFYLIPFATVQRYLIIYHYLPALIFSAIVFSIFFDETSRLVFKSPRAANISFLSLLFLVFITFAFFSPLTYGFPLTEKAFQLRMWLPTWNF